MRMQGNGNIAAENGRHAVLAPRLFDGRRWHEQTAVMIEQGRISGFAAWNDVPEGWPQRLLPPDTILAPGFIDLQVNGGGGVLLNDDPTVDTMRRIARVHRRFGTTSCLPTLITDSREQTKAAITAAQRAAGGEGILGLHVEGPFISPARPGVHRPDRISRPEAGDLEMLIALADAGRSVVTLAPECLPDNFIRDLSASGVRVSVGHSEASAEEVVRAAADGLTGVTHLFNAMPPLAGREPGIVGAALADDRLTAGLIVDGLHVHPVAVRAAFAAKGPSGMCLVSDAMPSVGTRLEKFDLMGRMIRLSQGRLTSEEGVLAGAHLHMASAVANAVRLAEVPLEDALRAATINPARFLGLDSEVGAIVEGACADLVALSSDITVVSVWKDGREEAETAAAMLS